MKRNQSVCSLLGIKQEDLALLLAVSRGHLSMFESGKRTLPVPAMQLLSEMLAYVNEQEKMQRRTTQKQQEESQSAIERQLHENQYQQLRLERTITATVKKQDAQLRLALLTEFLISREIESLESQTSVKELIARSTKQNKIVFPQILQQQQRRLGLLALEKTILEEKLRTLQQADR